MKKAIFLVLSLVVVAALQAKTIDVNTARTVAEKYYSNFVVKTTVNNTAVLAYAEKVTLASDKAATPCFYVFNIDKGFVIVSADDRVTPILGYSTESNFDGPNIPENVRFFLDGYRQEIRSILAMDDLEANPEWEKLENSQLSRDKDATVVVSPLLRTKWHQEIYYNSKCPVDSLGPNGHAYVGCGAIVMGQVMRYWKYPVHGIGSRSYTCNNASHGNGYGDYGRLSANFANTTYDYDNMPVQLTSTSSQVQIDAVATLLYHCGVAVKMNYGSRGSSVSPTNIVSGIKTYFGYPSTVRYIERANYNDASWLSTIKAELDSFAPFFYGGQSSSYGGHVWVCDGYRDDDCFHMNWGWGGLYDGYFTLSALSRYAFNNNQAAIIGLRGPQLPDPEPDVSCLNADNPDLRIYPNPSDGKFFVELTGTDDHLVKVFDMLGNEVTDITTAGSNAVVDLTSHPAGIYVVRVISNGNKVVTKRIIKK